MGHSYEFLSSKFKGLRYRWAGSNVFFSSIHIRVLHGLEQLGHLHWSKFLELSCLTTPIYRFIHLFLQVCLCALHGAYVRSEDNSWGVRSCANLSLYIVGFQGSNSGPSHLVRSFFYLLSRCNKGNKCETIWILGLFGVSSRRLRKILTANNPCPRM